LRFAIFDEESTKLKSDQGFLLCGGFKDLATGEKTILKLSDYLIGTDRLDIDHHLVVAIRDELEKYDGVITWNGLMFDLPLLDDRLMLCNEKPRRPLFARGLDMMWHARMGKSVLASSRLDWVAKALGCPFVKTPLNMNTWTLAEAEAIACLEPKFQLGSFKFGRASWPLGRSNFDEIMVHNDHDLDVTAWVYDRMKDRVQSISKR